MTPKLLLSALLGAGLLLASCGSSAEGPPAAEVTLTQLDGDYTVCCGCTLEAIGACGNYVLVEDDQPLELLGDHGLGVMEFCGMEDQTATVKGAVEDGAVVVTSFEVRG